MNLSVFFGVRRRDAMTPARRPNSATSDSSVSVALEEPASRLDRSATATGWYDPDGAAWEADRNSVFEAFRATPTRSGLLFDADDPDLEN
jgi:hypothetical protein